MTCATKKEDLPHLLRLLDDDNEIVRQGVREAFLGYGAELDAALQTLQDGLTPTQKALLNTLLESWVADRLREDWAEWIHLPGGTGKLEKGYELLARYRGGVDTRYSLAGDLDRLAGDFLRSCPEGGASKLIRYLFKERGFHGDQENYYAPENSDLGHLLSYRSGLPLTLTSLAILVGIRVGIEIRGCNLPRHFLACFETPAGLCFADCFNGGRIIREKTLVTLLGGREILDRVMAEKVRAEDIMARVLRNLAEAYRRANDRDRQSLMNELLVELESQPGAPPDARFAPGQVVRHRRYGYRGVIVDVDPECRADEEWYQSNRTQPDRNQPWYHVLVHGSHSSTYAAQDSLEIETEDLSVEHPLLNEFFAGYRGGRYVRNSRMWEAEP